ncbi:hypothetical protein KR044_004460 [Drosophila immigrans]|nr:hypothetical protein KR044_004460 [Drosophila immigrans]
MIITVKTLQQQTFTVDFDPEKTVLELKNRIFKERGVEYIVEKQKLIYAGVILTDERTISSYKVDERKFIVVMLTRDLNGGGGNCDHTNTSTAVIQQRKQLSSSSNETTNETSKSSKVDEESKPIDNGNVSIIESEARTKKRTPGDGNAEAQQTSTSPVTDAARTYSNNDLVGDLANASLQTRAESNLIMGEEYNSAVASIVEMGYARDQVERAMAASYNNPERAVEYLITGIPQENNDFNNDAENADESSRTYNLRRESLSDLQPQSTSDPFEFLRTQPQFLQMRSLIYQNPHLLHAVLQQIGQTNPALLQLISENQDAFLHMLNQPLEGEMGDNAQRIGIAQTPRNSRQQTENLASAILQGSAVADSQRPVAGADNASEDEPNSMATEYNLQSSESLSTIRLTPQDQDAIERLKALGFPEALVLQAYFACEKNEQLAANFLLSSSFDD